MALAQGRNFARGQARAPLEPVANGGLKLIEVAGVQSRGLRCLDRREDFNGIRPPIRIDDSSFQSKVLKNEDNFVKAGDDFRLAVVKKAVGDEGEAGEAPSGEFWRATLCGRKGAAKYGASSRSRKSQPIVSKDSAR